MPEDNNISFLISPERAREIQIQLGLRPERILTALQNGTLDVRATTSKQQQPQRSAIKPSYQGEIKDANKERLNRSLSNYAANNFLLSTSNIRPDQYGNYSPELGTFAGNQNVLTLSMGFDPFNFSNYYKAATIFPRLRNWGLSRTLASELNNEVKVVEELGKNVGSVPKTQFVFPQFKNVTKTVQDNGKIKLSLPSHTDTNPRQFVLEPQGNNKFYVHMRTWDGDHIPANLSNEDKQTLFQALYDELPEGGEILFPKSGPEYYGTRGTVAGLQRLSRDTRFTPGTKGTLQYIDKDGTIKTYEGTSFIKKSIQEPKTSLRFFERPQSKLSEAERAGIPKEERNLPKLRRSSIDFNLKNWRESLSPKISKDIDELDPIDVKKFGENDQNFTNRKYSTKLYLQEKNNRESSVFSTEPVNDIKQYASQLEAIDPRFLNDNGLQSFYIRDYRQYLNDLGYKAGDLTDTEIAKLLTDQYNTLSNTQTGKLKGQVVFHSGPNFFDAFDYSMTGSNTGNMGYLGPGNYFSIEPSVYGGKGNYSTQGFIEKYRYPRRQPYLITDIKSTPVSKELRKAGIVPEYTSPPREVYTDDVSKQNYIQNYIKPLIDATKSRDMAILDDISHYPHSVYTKGNQIEFNVPRNTGIKSLFPHPSLFIKDANGKIIINRNWLDPRVNFKSGGKIIEQFKNRNK